jgi:hypothetical protein
MSEIVTLKNLLSRYFADLRIKNWSSRTIDRRGYSLGRFICYRPF